MSPQIDIIVTYVDPLVKEGQEEKEFGEKEEQKQKKILISKQNTGECRYRNGDTFKYGFRGVEKNIPGINNIFLVVEDEKHIPEWLNVDHPKLKIIYHKDYIPQELLPTFNSNTIEMFFYKIPELADLYILSNDDMFIINQLPRKYFYDEGVIKDKAITGYHPQSGEFNRTLENNHKLLVKNKLVNSNYKFIPSHLLELHQKSLEQNFITKNYDDIYKSLAYSHFRHTINYTNGVLSDALKAVKTVKNNSEIYKHSYFINIRANGTFDINRAKNCEMLCLNDCPETDFEKAKITVHKFFEEVLPEKSSFEK